MADAIVLNYVDYESTIDLLNQIKNYKSIDHICVVDNASPNDSYARLKVHENDKIDVIRTEKNGGYGYGNNYGILYLSEKYTSKYILICNPDVIIEDGVINKLQSFLMRNKDYLISAPYMLNPSGEKQKNTAFRIGNIFEYIMSFGIVYSKLFNPGEYRNICKVDTDYIDVDAVAGSLFMIDVEKMVNTCMYDENMFLYCEERVLGMKCKNAGYKMALLPRCSFIHNHSVSVNRAIGSAIKKQAMMNESAMYVIKNYYNANIFWIVLGSVMMKVSIAENYIIEKIKRMRLK